MRLALALVIALAVGDPALAGSFPPGLVTDQQKMEWLTSEGDKLARAIAAEERLPPERRSRKRVEAMVLRRSELRELSWPILGSEYMPGSGAGALLSEIDDYEARQRAAAGRKADETRLAAGARAAEEKRLAAIQSAGYSPEIVKALAARKVVIGMTPDQIHLAWGKPQRVHERITASGRTEVWSYGAGSSLTLVNGHVVAIDTSR